MKRYILIIILFSIVNLLNAQEVDLRKKITVIGSADSTIQPDEFTLEIVLEAYGSAFGKKSLPAIEAQFKEILEKHKIDTGKLKFSGQHNYWYYWWCHRGKTISKKAFAITLDNQTNLLELVQDLDISGVSNLRVSDTTNKKLQEIRKEVKIKAIQAARDKAKYLLAAIDESLAGVIYVEEIPATKNVYLQNQNYALSNVSVSKWKGENDVDYLPSINIRYEVKAIFEVAEN